MHPMQSSKLANALRVLGVIVLAVKHHGFFTTQVVGEQCPLYVLVLLHLLTPFQCTNGIVRGVLLLPIVFPSGACQHPIT